MDNFERGRYSVTGEEKENMDPDELAALEDKIRKANAITAENESEKAIRETEEAVRKGLEEK